MVRACDAHRQHSSSAYHITSGGFSPGCWITGMVAQALTYMGQCCRFDCQGTITRLSTHLLAQLVLCPCTASMPEWQ
jgi:hypothetical protein